LRSFINQQALFQRDRNSIAVPYAAEQKLWAQLGTLMPPLIETAAVPATAVVENRCNNCFTFRNFQIRFFSAASVAVICLLIGLGSGFYVGKNSNSNSNSNTSLLIHLLCNSNSLINYE